MNRNRLAGLLVSWAIILLLGSILPVPIKEALHTTAQNRVVHPAVHVGCFVLLSVLILSFATSAYRMVVNLMAVIGFGFALEILEVFYYRQNLEVRDVLLDSYGAVIGFLLYLCARHWMRGRLLQIDSAF